MQPFFTEISYKVRSLDLAVVSLGNVVFTQDDLPPHICLITAAQSPAAFSAVA